MHVASCHQFQAIPVIDSLWQQRTEKCSNVSTNAVNVNNASFKILGFANYMLGSEYIRHIC